MDKVGLRRPAFRQGYSPVQVVRERHDEGTRVAAPARDKVTRLLFYGYLTLLVVEYCGLARTLIPLLQTIRFSTVLAYLLFLVTFARVGASDLFQYRQTRILVALVLFTAASAVWAVVQTYAVVSIRPMIDYSVLFFLTLTLVDRRARIDALSWAFAAIAVFVVARNLDMFGSMNRTGGFDAGYFMADGNDFSWALVVMMPIILNLVLGARSVIERLGGIVGVSCCMIGIVGAGSRGAALGVAAMAVYYLLVLSRRRLLVLLTLMGLGIAVLAAAPAGYLERLGTISQYEADNSAIGRLQAWGAAVRMASTYPLGVGAGNFSSAYGRIFRPQGDQNRLEWGQDRWISAHSIYFKTLGEYGFLGLALLLWLIIGNLKDSLALRKKVVESKTAPVPGGWPGLLGMSIVGHAVCGAFLGGIAYPHLFLLCGLTVASRRLAFTSVREGQQLPRNGAMKLGQR